MPYIQKAINDLKKIWILFKLDMVTHADFWNFVINSQQEQVEMEGMVMDTGHRIMVLISTQV